VATWGSKELQLSFSCHQFRYSFLLAAVDKPILGADILAQFRLLVDPYNKAVLFASTLAPIVAPSPLKNSPLLAALQQMTEVSRLLLAEFPGVLPVPGKHTTPLHGVSHNIETTGRQVFASQAS
jgi:hypothetical protein